MSGNIIELRLACIIWSNIIKSKICLKQKEKSNQKILSKPKFDRIEKSDGIENFDQFEKSN